MKRILIGAALALALASPAMAATRALHHVKHRPVASGLAIGKTSLPGKSVAAPAHHMRFGAIGGLQPGNSNPGFVNGQVPPAATWNQTYASKYDYAGGMLGGPLGLPAASGAQAQLYLTPGSPPTGTPPDGAVWYDLAQGVMTQQQGQTIGPLGTGGSGTGGNVNVTQWASQTVGTPTSYGIAPSSGLWPAVNAFITNTVPVTVGSLPLPAGAATQTTLASILSTLGSPLQAGGNVAVANTVTVQCPGGGTACFGGSVGANVSVVSVPGDATVAGSSPLTAADSGGSSSSSTGSGGQVIWTGAPNAPSVETFSLNTYQGALISARGTFTSTTTLVIEGTMDSASAQTAGTAKWVPEPVVIPGLAAAQSSFNAPFEQAAFTASGLQGVRCRIPSGQYTTSDSITCTVRTTLSQPGNALGGISAIHPLQVAGNIIQAGASIPINIAAATTVQLVAAISGKVINVTAWDVISNGTTTFTFVYGTGSNCVGGTTALTGPYGLVAQFGATKGSGLGTVLIIPAGNALCAVNSAAVQVSGSLAYLQ